MQEVKADEDDDNDEYELHINMDDIVQILNPQGHQLSDSNNQYLLNEALQ